MKRVLSIMLTLMLAFTMLSGITASAVEYEPIRVLTNGDYSTTVTPLIKSELKTGTVLNLWSGYSEGIVTLKEDLNSSIALGLTSERVFELTPNASGNTLRFYGHGDVETDEKYQVKIRVYLDGSSDASVNTFNASFGTNRKGYNSSSAGGSASFANIPVGQWTEVSAIMSPTKSSGNPRTANGFTVTFANGSAYPAKIYLDGNIYAAVVQEKAVESSAALAPIFKNNMVIQRNQPIDVWGTSTEAGKTVTVTLGENSATTTTDASGTWNVTLPAMSAQTGLTLNMTCEDEAQTNVNVINVAIGEVILAAGQSNMNRGVYTLHDTAIVELADDSKEVQDAVANLENVDVRMLNFNDNTANTFTWGRLSTYSSENGTKADNIYYRSLIGFMTAYKLAVEEKITVAFADAAYGGAAIRAFFSPETAKSRTEYAGFTVADPSGTDHNTLRHQSSGLYNIWLSHAKGMKFGSVIWYQGEQDAEESVSQDLYYTMLTDLINQFRSDFNNANLPVAVCQLAPYSNNGFVAVRQAQLDVSNDMDNVYLVTTADAGPTATETDAIHPVNKMPVINRCLNVIKHSVLGDYVEYSAPTYEKMTVSGNEATLTFSHAYGYDLLKTSKVADLSDTSSAAGYPRFGSSSGERWEFRYGSANAESMQVTRPKAAAVLEAYPKVAEGFAPNKTFAKLTRSTIKDTDFIRISTLVGNTEILTGDRFRIIVKVYPTDVMLSEGNRDANNTVKNIVWSYKGQRLGTSGHGDEEYVNLVPNQWNTIVLEATAYNDGVNGIYITPRYADGTDAFPATVFFDGEVTVEKLASADIASKSLKTSDGGAVTGFQIAGKDGAFYDADATINGNTITVSSENVANPVEVRYCYVPWAEDDHSTLGGNVVNAAGIPMGPFKAQAPNVAIDSVSGSGYTYTVNLSNSAYNTAPGFVVAALYDGDEFIQMKTVQFSIDERKSATKAVTFTPGTALSNPKVKIMAWKSMTTIVPYCEAVTP